jgi:choline-sulfatase
MRRAFLSLALLGIALGCGRADVPDLLLVTLDTVRADRIGTRTPHLDALAEEGVLFESAFSGTPLTLPSHATLLTGLRAAEHGVRDNGRFTLSKTVPTLGETLQRHGWATAAFVAAFVLDARFGLDRGFDVYDDAVGGSSDPLVFEVPSRRGEEVTERALGWLRGVESPFFLWVHYYDVHAPRDPPAPFDALGDAYTGELAYVDGQVGQLLAGIRALRPGRELVSIVVGDHGESLGEHGEDTHGVLAYDATLHVPLIAVGPRLPPGVRSREFVRTIDIAPTLLAAAGLPPLPGADGTALQEIVAGRGTTRIDGFEALAASLGLGWAPIRGVRTERWKLTLEPEPLELFDVREDPDELVNRLETEPAVVIELRGAFESLTRRPAAAAERPGLPFEARAQLAALGYLSTPLAPASGEPADPRRFAEALGWVEAARAKAARGELAEGLALLEALAASPVLRARALPSLAAVQRAALRHDDAIATLRTWQTEVATPEPALALAEVLLDADRPDEALRELAGAADSPRGSLLRSAALRRLGRHAEAIEAAEIALAAEPEGDLALAHLAWARAARDGAATEIPRLETELETRGHPGRWPHTRELLAELLRAEGRRARARELLESEADPPPAHLALLGSLAGERADFEAAARLYEAALAARPPATAWQLSLASMYDRLGRLEEAIALYDSLLAANPADATYHLDRGALLARSGRTAQARAGYERALALDPSLAEAHLNRALLSLADGDREAALRGLERAVELRPDYAKAHLLLARLLGEAGDPSAAEHAERALATEVGDP